MSSARTIDASGRERLSAALASFTVETTLGAEHRRLMDAHHKAIDWSESSAASLSPELRLGLADLWRSRMVAEHRSIGIFNLFALDLLGAGAPAEVLSLACRAALDEVRHAELFARLATLYSGERETPPPGIPPMPDDPSVPMSQQVAREALHLCVCSESYSAATLAELHARSSDAAVKGALAVVLSDEIYHARLGWALLSTMLEPSRPDAASIRESLQGEILPMFDGFLGDLFGDPTQLPPPSLEGRDLEVAEAHGYMSARDEYAMFRASIDDIWVPGLAGLGLDPGALRGRYPNPR